MSIVSHSSGGEKRRVSLAAAFLHEPPLLILDEPTSGIDTVLRAKYIVWLIISSSAMLLGCALILYRVWEHLLQITSTSNTTVILTTHYIEEARQAHMVIAACDLNFDANHVLI